MPKLRVSAKARRDLQDIGRAGTREFGRAASAAHVESFRRLFRVRRDQAFASQAWPKRELGVQSLPHRPHHILYRVGGDVVTIERILRQARDGRQIAPGSH